MSEAGSDSFETASTTFQRRPLKLKRQARIALEDQTIPRLTARPFFVDTGPT